MELGCHDDIIMSNILLTLEKPKQNGKGSSQRLGQVLISTDHVAMPRRCLNLRRLNIYISSLSP